MKPNRGALSTTAAARIQQTQLSAAFCGLSLATVVIGTGCLLAGPMPNVGSQVNERSHYFGIRQFGIVWERLRAVLGHAKSDKANHPIDKHRLVDKISTKTTDRKWSTFKYTDDLMPLDAASASWHPNVVFVPCFSSKQPNGQPTVVAEDRMATPSNLLEVFGSSFYWGAIDRHKAESVLENKPEGTFLLRDSAHAKYLFSVSFRKYDRTLHARIELCDSRYSFDWTDATVFTAPTLAEMIRHYGDPNQCMYFEPQLSHPLNRNFTFSLAEICRATIVGCCADSNVDLPLPPRLREFVQEFRHKPALRSHSTS